MQYVYKAISIVLIGIFIWVFCGSYLGAGPGEWPANHGEASYSRYE